MAETKSREQVARPSFLFLVVYQYFRCGRGDFGLQLRKMEGVGIGEANEIFTMHHRKLHKSPYFRKFQRLIFPASHIINSYRKITIQKQCASLQGSSSRKSHQILTKHARTALIHFFRILLRINTVSTKYP